MIDPFDVLRDELVRAAARTRTPAKQAVWWSRRRSHPVVALVAALAIAGTATAAVVSFTSTSSAPLLGRVPGHAPPLGASPNDVAGDTYRITVAPLLQAGTAGLCTSINYRPVVGQGGFGWGGCGGPYPTTSQPFFGHGAWAVYPGGRIPAGGVIEYILTGPGVAAVRVGADLTVTARSQPGLPAGDRAVVFYLPAGSLPVASPGVRARWLGLPSGVQPLTLTALDRFGRPIPTTSAAPIFRLPARFWQRPEPQPRGSCALTAPSGFSALRGTVVYRINPVPGVQGAALLSCLSTDYSVNGTTVVAAVLLNARSPASPPPAIFGATAVSGNAGFVNRDYPSVLSLEPITARRDGNAWLVVQGGHDLAQRLDVLRKLEITRIDLTSNH
jgi:hypothetical protein